MIVPNFAFFNIICFLTLLLLLKLGCCNVQENLNQRMEGGVKLRKLLQSQSQSQTFEEYFFSLAGCDPNSQDCQDLDNDCVDEAPEEATFDCREYFRLGLCSGIPESFCQLSCNRCSSKQPVLPSVPPQPDDIEPDVSPQPDDILLAPPPQQFDIEPVYMVTQLLLGLANQSIQASTPPLPDIPLNQSLTPDDIQPFQTPDDCDLISNLNCDVEALLKFKDGLQEGSQQQLSSWSGVDPCNNWQYIACSSTAQRVTSLQLVASLSDNNVQLQGSLIPEFSKLRFLKELRIVSHSITGQLFKEFSVLNNLTILELSTLQLNGNLPVEYSVLKNLTEFSVGYNRLSGAIPKQYSVWNQIQIFQIAGNKQITGNLNPEFSMWKDVFIFDAGDISRLKGTIPAQFSELKEMMRFSVALNVLNGSLPEQFSIMKQMEELFVAGNILSGTLPKTFSTWKNCREFHGQINRFTGALPIEYSEMQKIQTFNVQRNNLNGSLPIEYSIMQELKVFQASDNRITGTVPTEWDQVALITV